MRKWQVDYIRSHQCLILQTVTCDTVLKASLIEKGVLDEAEEQELVYLYITHHLMHIGEFC